jgi:hypothetical protein
MWMSVAHDEVTKIFVERDQDPAVAVRERQNGAIPGIGWPIFYRFDAVTGSA